MSSRWASWTRDVGVVAVRGPALNLAICLALLTGGMVELASLRHAAPLPVAFAACILCTLAPALGWRFPASAALLAVASVAIYQVVTDDPNGDFVVAATVIASYYLGRDHPGTTSIRRRIGVAVVAVPAFVVAGRSDHQSVGASVGTWLSLVVAPVAVGWVVARRQALVRQLELATRALQLDQQRAAAAATTTERARVARELHDVVAHHVSVMVIQAGAARMVGETDPDAARAALDAVESAGRRSLDELRRVLGVLRRAGDADFDRAVDAARLQELCASVAGAGVTATLTAAPLDALPASVALAAYRIVQEALTNVARHAAGAIATVAVGVDAGQVEIVVRDDGRRLGPAVAALPSGGHGLVGMAERAAWAGGRLAVGPRPGGGFEVRAWLPLEPSDLLVRPAAADETRLADPVSKPARRRRFGVVPTVLIGWRPRHPLAYVSCLLAVMMGLAIVSPAVYDVGLVGVLSLVVPTYAIAAWLPARTAAVGFVVWSAGAGVNAVRDHSSVSRFVGGYLMAIVIFALARVVRSQRILSTALAARNLALAERRDDRARAAVASERIRIARDLHVHIAALIGAMVVQATAAKQRVTADLRGALDAAGAVEQDGREVLSQMRRVLGVLRSDREVPLRPVYAEELGPPPLVPA